MSASLKELEAKLAALPQLKEFISPVRIGRKGDVLHDYTGRCVENGIMILDGDWAITAVYPTRGGGNWKHDLRKL
jgi:hypothetical protein